MNLEEGTKVTCCQYVQYSVKILLAKSLGILAVTGCLEGLVEGERHIAGDGKVIERGVGKSLCEEYQLWL
jgi:hypothetical protein